MTGAVIVFEECIDGSVCATHIQPLRIANVAVKSTDRSGIESEGRSRKIESSGTPGAADAPEKTGARHR